MRMTMFVFALFCGAVAQGSVYSYLFNFASNNSDGAASSFGALDSIDGSLHVTFSSTSPDAWTVHMRPTVDCPGICNPFHLENYLAQPFPGTITATYGGATYSSASNPAGNTVTSFVLTAPGLFPSVIPSLSQVTDAGADTTTYRGTYMYVSFFSGTIALHNGGTGIDSVVDFNGFTEIRAMVSYVTRTSTGEVLSWQEQEYLQSPLPADPGLAAAWADIARRRRLAIQ